jgi:hypothetical protein
LTTVRALNDLIARLGAELDFDVARHVEAARGIVDVIWFDSRLPLVAVGAESLDLREAPVLPLVAFATHTAALEECSLEDVAASLEHTCAPLRIVVIGRDSKSDALAPALQSIDQLRRRDEEAILRTRVAALLRERAAISGRTIVMLQCELVAWARRLREVRPRSYSAESLFNRTGAID